MVVLMISYALIGGHVHREQIPMPDWQTCQYQAQARAQIMNDPRIVQFGAACAVDRRRSR